MPLPLLLVHTLIDELDREGHSTARLLERVPADRLEWRPHAKSMPLGDLAWHVATIPGRIATIVRAGAYDISGAMPEPRGGNDFTGEFRRNQELARRLLLSFDESALSQPFTITHRGQTVVTMHAAGAIRTLMFNHSYHHRGQLTVYLRLLDVALPVIYGSTADERP